MDKKKTSATASSASGKNSEKKEKNFLTKTAHSIRDKVQGLTDEVKEKTQNLTRSGDSKKTKSTKDRAKTETKSKPSSQPLAAGKKDSGEESDDEDDSPKTSSGPTTSTSKNIQETKATKGGSNTNTDKSAPSSSETSATTDKSTASKTDTASTQLVSRGSADKLSNDQKDAQPKKSSSMSKLEAKSFDEKTSSEPAHHDHVHINFYGVSTVDDVLNRIDRAVEKAKIVVEKSEGPVFVHIDTKPSAIPADLEKRPAEKTTTAKTEIDSKDQKNDPIRIDYNEIHELEDLLLKVNNQPGSRKVILENAPKTDASNDVHKQANPFFPPAPPPPPLASLTTTSSTSESDDDPPKSILKTSQDPSSLDTLTKVASFQDDQIHVNIEGNQNVNDLPNETEDKSQEEEKQQQQQQQQQNEVAQTRNLIDVKKQLTPSLSLPSQKREAPKAPHVLTAQDDISTTKSAEKFSSSENDIAPINSPTTTTKEDADEHTEWI